MSKTALLSKTGDIFAGILFPAFCYGCGEEKTYLCTTCTKKVRALPLAKCPHCNAALASAQITRDECRKNIKADAVISAGYYKDPVLNRLIKDYKYKNARVLAETLSRFFIKWLEDNNFLKAVLNDDPLIIPVPSHARKHRIRGFRHTLLISEHLSNALNIQLESGALVKTRKTKSQTQTADRQERKNNLKNAFQVTDKKAVKDRKILLVDDVITTSSTVNECAKVLRRAGAQEVWALSIAKD